MRLLHDDPGYRRVNGIPFEKIELDWDAVTVAADYYASQVGDCDEIALGAAITLYLESERVS